MDAKPYEWKIITWIHYRLFFFAFYVFSGFAIHMTFTSSPCLHIHSNLFQWSFLLPVLLPLYLLLPHPEAWTQTRGTWIPSRGVYFQLLDSRGPTARASPIVLFCARDKRRRDCGRKRFSKAAMEISTKYRGTFHTKIAYL